MKKGTTVDGLLILGVPVGTSDTRGGEDGYGGRERGYSSGVFYQAKVSPAHFTRVGAQSENGSEGNNGPGCSDV